MGQHFHKCDFTKHAGRKPTLDEDEVSVKRFVLMLFYCLTWLLYLIIILRFSQGDGSSLEEEEEEDEENSRRNSRKVCGAQHVNICLLLVHAHAIWFALRC